MFRCPVLLLVRRLAQALLLIMAVGCEQTAGLPSGAAGAAGQPAPDVESGGFAQEVWPLMAFSCNCHQSEPLMATFSLKAAEAYANLVGVPSLDVPGMLRVQPGRLNDSYLWHKVNDTHLEVGGAGAIMPPTVPLTADERELIGRWIAAGAMP